MDSRKQDSSSVGKALLFTLNVAGWLWSAVSFFPWYYLSGNYKKMKPGRIQAKLTPQGTYRCVENLDNLVVDFDGLKTINEVFA